MRAGPLLAVLMLAACSEAGGNGAAEAPVNAATTAAAPDDNRVECRLAGDGQFERFCTIERNEGPDGATLLLRKPDGGFRRLRVATDGRGVVAADGAEPARVTILRDDRIEVAIGGDAFRLPATVRRQ
jgi:hypothetical protein